MVIQSFSPSLPLSDYIQSYWLLDQAAGEHAELVYPTGEIQLLLHFEKPFTEKTGRDKIIEQPRFTLCGQRTIYSTVYTQSSACSIGIIFYPHAAAVFFPFPLHEIKNAVIDMSDIFADWKTCQDQLLDLSTVSRRLQAVENYLIQKINISNLKHYRLVKSCLNQITASQALHPVRQICNDYQITERTLQRLFNQYVGIPPKTYSEIAKINRAIRLLKSRLNLTDISFEAGYYDQSHWIRNFKKYTGNTPSQLKKIISFH